MKQDHCPRCGATAPLVRERQYDDNSILWTWECPRCGTVDLASGDEFTPVVRDSKFVLVASVAAKLATFVMVACAFLAAIHLFGLPSWQAAIAAWLAGACTAIILTKEGK